MVMARLTTTVVMLATCLQVGGAEPLSSSRERLASVQVGGCSGTIIAVHGKRAFGLSVAHCAKVGKSVVVTFADGSTGEGKWVLSKPDIDLSFFECKSRDILGHVSAGSRGKTVTALGRHGRKSMDYSSDEEVTDTTTGKKLHRSEYKMSDGVLRDGDSGGGVFTLGKLCGVISHGHDKDMLYACRETDLRAFLLLGEKELGLDFCPEDWGDKDRTREIIVLKKRVKDLEDALSGLRLQIGEAGKTGPAGRAGPAGPAGPAGRDGKDGGDGSDATVDLSSVVKRIQELEQWKNKFRATVRIRLKPRELRDAIDR